MWESNRKFSRKKNEWQRKVPQTCGVAITEKNYLPQVICQICGKFVNKMWEFKQEYNMPK